MFSGYLYDRAGNGIAPFSATAPVVSRTAAVQGTVFGDANANGRADRGEGVRGLRLRLDYAHGPKGYRVTTGHAGAFRIEVPTAGYYLSGSGQGWVVVPGIRRVGSTGATWSLRAVRPLGKVLTASLHFTKATYAPGAKARIDITLRNTGAAPLRGISAACARVGDPDELTNRGRGWGPLAWDRAGLNLAPHHARTVHVIAKVPAVAQRAGQVVAACDFGYPAVDQGYRPQAFDSAKVPGQYGAIAANVYYRRGTAKTMVGLKNVRLVVVDPTACPVLTRKATSDAKGNIRISHLPAGSGYELYLFPPKGWKVRYGNPSHGLVFGKDTMNFGFEVQRGTARVPTVPTRCG